MLVTESKRNKIQEFAHKILEFADTPKCMKFYRENQEIIDFNRSNAIGWTILMSVCACGRSDLISYVMDQTTNIACRTLSNCTTVLHLAMISQNRKVIQELLGTEERIQKCLPIRNAGNIGGDTPLMMACVAKSTVAVELLIKKLKVDVNACNQQKMSALMCACMLKQHPHLLEAYSNDDEDKARSAIHKQNSLEYSMCAVSSVEIIHLLLDNGGVETVNLVEKAKGCTALHFAVKTGNVEAIRLLLRLENIDFSIPNYDHVTPEDALKARMETSIKMDVDDEIKQLFEAKWQELNEKAASYMDQLILADNDKHYQILHTNHIHTTSIGTTEQHREPRRRSTKKRTSKRKKKQGRVQKHYNINDKLLPIYDKMDLEKKSRVYSSDSDTSSELSNRPVGNVRGEFRTTVANEDELKQKLYSINFNNEDWQEVRMKKSKKKEIFTKSDPSGTHQSEIHNPATGLEDTNRANLDHCVLGSDSLQSAPVNYESKSRLSSRTKQPGVSNFSINPSSHVASPQLGIKTCSSHIPTSPSVVLHSSSSVSSPISNVLAVEDAKPSYDELNDFFHKSFPLAGELEIDVKYFLAAGQASLSGMRQNRPFTNSNNDETHGAIGSGRLLGNDLSIAQVEVLQKAHLQAYEYLNEKRIELTRILEVQKLEAQYRLSQSYMNQH